MNPSTGTFISMDSYQGSLEDPVSLHKYLYANANPVMYTDPSGYFSIAECSIAQAINGILDKSRLLSSLKGIEFIKKATLACNAFNIGVQIKNIIFADDLVDVVNAAISIVISGVSIANYIKPVGFVGSMVISGFGTLNALQGLITSIINKNWSEVVYNLGFLCIDFVSMGVEVDEHCFEEVLKQSRFFRTENQEILINLTKEVKKKPDMTGDMKNILFDWAKEYDAFEDIWNLIYHID